MPLRFFTVLLGAALLSAALLLDPLMLSPFQMSRLQWGMLAAGIFFLLLGILIKNQKRVPVLTANIFSAGISLFLTIVFLEFFLRFIGFDFFQGKKMYYASPVYFRQPIKPVGDIYFRRSGPEVWTGKVLTGGMRVNKIKEITEIQEEEITVRYDEEGFRNDPFLKDWDIVMAGDSFLELGYLKDEDLFSVLAGKKLHKKIKNMGVSYTGPLNYTYCLKAYGKASSTKDAVMVFYEGNDLADLKEENAALKIFQEAGKRPERKFKKQTSFFKYMRSLKGRPRERSVQNAYFKSGGKEIPVSVENFPKPSSELSEEEKQQLDQALEEWAKTAGALGIKPWLVYMPAKIRVLYGSLRFNSDRVIGSNWKPNDLNDYVAGLCRKHGIEFIDVTPALREKTKQGILTYNALWDTHLNREGSHTAAQVLAEKMEALSVQNPQ